MDFIVALAALVCAAAVAQLAAQLVQCLRYAARQGVGFWAGYAERLWRRGISPARLRLWFAAVALSLAVLLAASGNIRHLLGSKALRHQPDGSYAYTIETGEGPLPGVVEIVSRPSKLIFTAEDGSPLTERSKSYCLSRLERPGGTLTLPAESEISTHGTVYFLIGEGESISARLLDVPAEIAGFVPVARRGLFYWLDIIVPFPVALYLAHLAAAIHISKKESVAAVASRIKAKPGENRGERKHG